MLKVQELSVSYSDLKIVDNISFESKDNSWTMICGPNGAGKSTIVSAIAGLVNYEGKVLMDGIDLKKMKQTEIARKLGILSQYHYVTYGFSVREVVSLGRYSYKNGLFSSKDENYDEAINNALELCGLKNMEDKRITNLSGGELQRVFLAQIFCQDPKILILDEPTNHLDLIYQKQIFEIINEWIKREDKSAICVIHDLSLARKYADEVILLNKGKIVAKGPSNQSLTRDTLREVYSLDVFDWMHQMYSQWED